MKSPHRQVRLLVLALFAGASLAKGGLPPFKTGESYARVRTTMIRAGWKPFHSDDADRPCYDSDPRCEGRPAMESCAGTGLANCRFLWRKGRKSAAICPIGEAAVFASICG